MQLGSPFDALHNAIARACATDLPDIQYKTRDWDNPDRTARIDAVRRPIFDEVEVKMFLQAWGSTALGYGGVGGASMTTAYTVVVYRTGTYCVYFGCGELAYTVSCKHNSVEGMNAFLEDVRYANVASRKDATKYL